ncbi:unnamed protein product [Cuscuta europaea]|uniref:Uncharacterized protein n=1 Tax=Cuscuta europaea TaxID=41803 RepID=A0A9P0Z521_CUSEU|nr:unnamed protein product [Cuscuta europaea]
MNENNDCGFFEWHDDPLTDRVKNVINDFKRDNRRLHTIIKGLEKVIRAEGSFDEAPVPECVDTCNEKMELKLNMFLVFPRYVMITQIIRVKSIDCIHVPIHVM